MADGKMNGKKLAAFANQGQLAGSKPPGRVRELVPAGEPPGPDATELDDEEDWLNHLHRKKGGGKGARSRPS
jgi:hypothetical protein